MDLVSESQTTEKSNYVEPEMETLFQRVRLNTVAVNMAADALGKPN